MSSGKFQWCYEDFCEFYEDLTLPNGDPARLEGFQRLILRFIFAGYVELLILIPKGQAKTTLMAALAVYHLLITPNANCYIGAATKTQAGEMFRFACHFVESEPELSALLKPVKSTKEIFSRRDQGFLRVLASDDSKQGGKAQGFNPTLALIDELHAHENDNLYVDMRSGLFKSKGLLIVITTAGWDTEGVLGLLRAGFLAAYQLGGSVHESLIADDDGFTYEDVERGRLTLAYTRGTRPVDADTFHRLGAPRKGSAMLEWALRPEGHPLGEDDPDDMEVVKLANPASWVTVDSLQDALDAPGITPWIFRRYRCNLWTLAFDSWLPASAWLSLKHPDVPVLESRSWLGAKNDDLDAYIASLFPRGMKIAGAIDMARYRDCAAITVIGDGPEGKRLPRWIIWRSGGHQNPIPYGPTKRAWQQLHRCYDLRAGGFDEKYYDQTADELIREGIRMELFSQTNERMCPAAADLRGAIVTEQKFAHDGDPIATAHIMSAVSRDVGDGQFKLVKTKETGPPIDGCITLAMANVLDSLPDIQPWAGFA
jgi:hypothetical protein